MQNYVLGHTKRELSRLILQAANLRPITTRLLGDIGLVQGMRVVDLGCGTGDVAMLAAEMVGTTGAVLGIDRDAAAIATARERARVAGYANIDFVEGDASEMIGSGNCDLAIGRYVLVHQSDPVALIRAAVTHLRRGAQLRSMKYYSSEHGGPFPWCRYGRVLPISSIGRFVRWSSTRMPERGWLNISTMQE